MHSRSICELPKWTGGEYYDSFHKGLIGSSTNDTLTADYLEYVMDNCRYFAEGCDHLTTIEVVAEHVGGSAGLTTSLLQALREEFGHSVCVPVWSVSGRKSDLAVLNYDGATLLDSISTMKNKVTVLDSALFYNKATEFCNFLVPISLQEILSSILDAPATEEDRQYNIYLATAVAASAILTASSYQTTPVRHETNATELIQSFAKLDPRQQQRFSTFSTASVSTELPQEVQLDNAHQWCAAATQRSRLPVCFLEAGFPGILQNREKGPSDAVYDGLEQYLIDTFDTKKYPIRAIKSEYLRTINPFTVPLSPVPFAYRHSGIDGEGQKIVAKLKEFPYHRAFSNLLSVRGCSGEGLRESLYMQCVSRPYRISSCQLNAAPLYVSSSSPFHNDTDEEHNLNENRNAATISTNGEPNTYTNPYTTDNTSAAGASGANTGSCVELVTAVHTSALVGEYLAQQTGLWRAACSLQAVAVQLDKAGVDRTECAELAEQLQELAQRYHE